MLFKIEFCTGQQEVRKSASPETLAEELRGEGYEVYGPASDGRLSFALPGCRDNAVTPLAMAPIHNIDNLKADARAKIERSRELGAYVPKAAAAVVSRDLGTQFIFRDTPEEANKDARMLAMHNRQYGLSGNRVDWYGDLV